MIVMFAVLWHFHFETFKPTNITVQTLNSSVSYLSPISILNSRFSIVKYLTFLRLAISENYKVQSQAFFVFCSWFVLFFLLN